MPPHMATTPPTELLLNPITIPEEVKPFLIDARLSVTGKGGHLQAPRPSARARE